MDSFCPNKMYRFKSKDEVLEIVKKDGLALSHCSNKHRKDFDIASAALEGNEYAIDYIKGNLLSNHKIMYKDSNEIQKKYANIFRLLSIKPHIFHTFSLEMKSDKFIVGKLVNIDIKYYDKLPNYLKEDLYVLDCLLKRDPKQFLSLPNDLQEDREVIKIALNYSGDLIEKIPKYLREDTELIFIAIYTYPAAFKNASESMKKDKEFFFKAISIHPNCFEFGHPKIQRDKDCIKMMIQKQRLNLYLVEDIIKKYFNDDDEIVYLLVKNHGILFKNIIHSKYKSDKNLLLHIMNHPPSYNIFDYFKEFLQDKEIVLKALPKYPLIYRDLNQDMKQDKEIILAAIKSDFMNYNLLSQEMRLDEDCFQTLVTTYINSKLFSQILNYIPEKLHNREEIKLIIKHVPWNILQCKSEFKDDRDLIKSCILKSNVLPILPNFSNDREIVLFSMKYYNVISYLSNDLFYDEDFIVECFKINQKIFENARFEKLKFEPLFKSKKIAKEVGKLKSEYFKHFTLEVQNDFEVYCYVNGMYILLFHQNQDKLKDIHLTFF